MTPAQEKAENNIIELLTVNHTCSWSIEHTHLLLLGEKYIIARNMKMSNQSSDWGTRKKGTARECHLLGLEDDDVDRQSLHDAW
jgi:hypothetical protein